MAKSRTVTSASGRLACQAATKASDSRLDCSWLAKRLVFSCSSFFMAVSFVWAGSRTDGTPASLLGVVDGGVAVDQVAVVRDVVGEQRAQALDVVAPVAVEFAGDAEPGHQLGAGSRHAIPGGLAGQFVEGARGVGDDEDLVALLKGRQRGKGNADLGDDAGDDQLLLAGGLDGLDEVLVVPGVDLAGPGDVRRLRKGFLQFGHQRAVRPVLEAGGPD